MTSMLFTDSATATAGSRSTELDVTDITLRLAFLRAVARRDLLFSRVLRCALLDHLAHHRTVAGHERRHRLEFLAVPLLELHHARAFVIEAARLDRWKQSGCAKLLQARLREVEML